MINDFTARLGSTITSGLYSTAILTAVFSMFSIGLNAEPLDHGDHHQQQETHLHGQVEMTLAIEGNTIELNLESPAANIVGFEHSASTPEQHASVNRAKSILDSPEQLLTFIGTGCKATRQEVDVSAVLAAEDDDHKEEAHDEHDEHDEHGETHSEISARYQFHCAQGAKLTAIKVQLFDLFPGIETVRAAWVSDSHQASAMLTADSITINLKGK